MARDWNLIPPNTQLSSNGEGAPEDIGSSQSRTFLCTMSISNQIEQEAVDLSIWGSADGQDWGKFPLLKMPQRFYRGETRQILDLSAKPEIRFLRAKWELTRWGRVAPHPMFVLGFQITEVPAFAHTAVAQ